MAGSLGSLVVSLGMDTARFTADAGKAAQQMGRLTAEAARIGTAIGVAVGAGINMFGRLIKSSIDTADATSKMSQGIGISTEALSQLEYAAGLSGLAAEELTGGLGRLAKKASDAAGGLKEAQDIFATLAIKTTDGNGALRNTEDLLGDVADKFAGWKDGAGKTAIAMEIFGRSGAKLIPFLNQGRKGLEELREEADRLGLTLTGSAGKAAEQFNDNLERIHRVQEGFFRQVAQQLAPTLSSLTDQFLEGAKNGGVFSSAVEAAATAVKLLIGSGTILATLMAVVGKTIGGVAATVSALFTDGFAAAGAAWNSFYEDLEATTKGAHDTLAALINPTVKAGEAMKKTAEEGKGIPPVIDKTTKSAPKMSDAMKALQKANENAAESLKKLKRELEDISRTDLQKTLADIEEQRKNGVGGAIIAEQKRYAELVDAEKWATEEATKALEEHKTRVQDARTAYEAIASPVEKYIAEVERITKMKPELDIVDPKAYDRMIADAQKAYEDGVQQRHDALYTGLLTEEESIAQSYERRKATILAATEATELEKQDLLARLDKAHAEQLAAAEQARNTMMLQGAQNLFGGLADLSKNYGGEQSKTYRALFALSKAFSIAQAALAIGTGLAKAQELGFPLNLVEMARVAAAGASIVGQIQGANFSGGYDKGGYIPPGKWGIVGERGMEAVSGPANVTGREQTAAMLKKISEQGAQPRVLQVIVKGDGDMSNKTATQQGRQIGLGIQRAMARNG